MRMSKRLYEIFTTNNISKKDTTFNLFKYSPQNLLNHLNTYINTLCEYCNCVIITMKNCSIDHIVPLCSAETEDDILKLNALYNLRLICRSCNSSKASKDKKLSKRKKIKNGNVASRGNKNS